MHQAMSAALTVALPILVVSLLVGVAVSIFQAVTQISEMTLTFVPKLLGVALVLVLAGPWMLHRLLDFTVRMFALLPQLGR
jgi:flagellar biosynthetic protein FliQ